jgi:hypothetical protein
MIEFEISYSNICVTKRHLGLKKWENNQEF